MSKLLTRHGDIREWAASRAGNPALAETPDGASSRITLQIVFDQYRLNAEDEPNNERPGALELVSWDDWFAEFDKQRLALKVDDEAPGLLDSDHEFVAR